MLGFGMVYSILRQLLLINAEEYFKLAVVRNLLATGVICAF